MKRFKEIIAESVRYSTARTFTPGDWLKTYHTYALDVINNLLDGIPILIGEYGAGGHITGDQFVTETLKEIRDRLEKGELLSSDVKLFNDSFKGKSNKIWSDIYKGVYSGQHNKVSTKDQESLCCVVFNNAVETMRDSGNFHPDLDWLKDMCIIKANEIGISEDKKWINSIALVVECILNQLKKLNVNISKFRMERYKGLQRGQKLAETYADFVEKYRKATNQNKKDTIDPSDVIIYNTEEVSKIEKVFNTAITELNTNDPVSVKNNIINELYKSENPIFGAISLKQVSSKPEFLLINVEESKIKVAGIEPPMVNKTEKTCAVVVSGFFGQEKYPYAKLEYRTAGEGKSMRCEVSLLYKDKRRADSQSGDCPIEKFDEIVGLPNHKPINIEDKFNKFIKFIDSKDLDALTEIVRLAKKEGDICLPHILIQ